MKKIILILIPIIIAFVWIACEKEEECVEKKFVTYGFTNDDRTKLLPIYTEGQVFSFGADDRKFEVVEVWHGIRYESTGGGKSGPAKKSFGYEEKQITLKDYESEKLYVIHIKRYPNKEKIMSAKFEPCQRFPSQLTLQIRGDNSRYDYYGMIPVRVYYDSSTTTLTVNGFTYTKVHILDRSRVYNFQQSGDRYCVGSMFNEAQYTYFDEDYGIIGFDSFDGQELRLEKK